MLEELNGMIELGWFKVQSSARLDEGVLELGSVLGRHQMLGQVHKQGTTSRRMIVNSSFPLASAPKFTTIARARRSSRSTTGRVRDRTSAYVASRARPSRSSACSRRPRQISRRTSVQRSMHSNDGRSAGSSMQSKASSPSSSHGQMNTSPDS